MGELFDERTKKRDRGILEVCGKMKEGDNVLTGCVAFQVVDGKPLALEGSGHPKVQDELRRRWRERIKIG